MKHMVVGTQLQVSVIGRPEPFDLLEISEALHYSTDAHPFLLSSVLNFVPAHCFCVQGWMSEATDAHMIHTTG